MTTPGSNNPGTPQGGLGGAGARRVRDTRLIERALRERWPISAALHRELIDKLQAIINDPKASRREATSAAKALMEASRINLETVRTCIAASQHVELEEQLTDLEERLKANQQP